MNTKPATFAQIALFARLIEERRFHNGQTVPEALGDRDFEAWFAVLLNDGDRMSEYTTWLLDLYPAA